MLAKYPGIIRTADEWENNAVTNVHTAVMDK